jgi:hypothetical protein
LSLGLTASHLVASVIVFWLPFDAFGSVPVEVLTYSTISEFFVEKSPVWHSIALEVGSAVSQNRIFGDIRAIVTGTLEIYLKKFKMERI